MIPIPSDSSNARITVARQSLQAARDRLDAATGALPDCGDDDTMASPALLGLLLHAVAAKRHLADLETAIAKEPGTAQPRHTIVPSGERWP